VPDATTYRYAITVLAVHDGDTLTVAVDLGFSIAFTTPIRLAGVNAPELATRTPTGDRPGIVARDALRAFVASFPTPTDPVMRWTAQTYKTGQEKYGRWLARVTAPDGTDLSAWLVASGFATVYEP
jgi:micrococcal nuclease